eukprot:5024896-Alexandrium_andersonii.AAC.1
MHRLPHTRPRASAEPSNVRPELAAQPGPDGVDPAVAPAPRRDLSLRHQQAAAPSQSNERAVC